MFSKIIRIFAIFIAAALLACAVYLSKLYRQTTVLFENLKPKLTQNSNISQAELFIGDLLFDETIKTQATPAAFIARGQLNTQPQDTMFNYHIKGRILAYRLNSAFSDEQLLSAWLSSVYFGKREYGLEAAAQSLFNKKTDTLSQDELISLAALIKHPTLRSDPQKGNIERKKLEQGLKTNAERP